MEIGGADGVGMGGELGGVGGVLVVGGVRRRNAPKQKERGMSEATPSKLEKLSKERQRRQRIVRDMAMDPVDRCARIITGKGVSFSPLVTDDGSIKVTEKVLMRAVKYRPDNLRHRKFGKFTVLGLTVDYPGRWLVQCQCGTYELRRAKAIKNPANAHDACASCKQENKLLAIGRERCFVGQVISAREASHD